MKLFTADQIKEWDNYTILHEPVSSLELMERAATSCLNWIITNNLDKKHFILFCGSGNNGGDGLALARLMVNAGIGVSAFVLQLKEKGSDDFEKNLSYLNELAEVKFIHSFHDLPIITTDHVVVDALFGSGLNKPVEGLSAGIIDYINSSNAIIISIDIPSGLYADRSSKGNTIIKATYTLSFQQYKLCLILPENEEYSGQCEILNIDLNKDFYNKNTSSYFFIDETLIASIYKPRKPYSHKGNYGHCLILAGSYGMMGAALLAVKAALRSGAGKVTAGIPETGIDIMQGNVPEAICMNSGKKFIKKVQSLERFNAIGIGPGMGRSSSNRNLLQTIFTNCKMPLVLDADALNEMADSAELLNFIPKHSILTPHPKEFQKLFGQEEDDFKRLQLALLKAVTYSVFIILKGHHTFIACPDGKGYFNSTGNPGMATGGSGDVLTGILTGLLSQGYEPLNASILGVYLHGLAGDFAAADLSQEAMISGDIIDYLGEAFKMIKNLSN